MRALPVRSMLIGLAILYASGAAAATVPFELVRGSNPYGLRPIWGSSGSDVFVAGGAQILHYDGSRWSKMHHPAICEFWDNDCNDGFESLWGASGSDVFALTRNAVMHYDGLAWSWMALPLRYQNGQNAVYLSEIWGSSGHDVYIAGIRDGMAEGTTVGLVLHYDGTSWTELAVPQTGPRTDFRAVWGTTANDVFVAGDGVILHFDGTAWSTSLSCPGGFIWKIRGASATDVLAESQAAGGWERSLLHYDGSSWSRVTDLQVTSNSRILGAAGGSVYVSTFSDFGLKALRYDGSGFFPMPWPQVGEAAWGASANDLFALDDDSIYHYDGTKWTLVVNVAAIVDAWGSSASDVFALTLRHGILHYDGEAWSLMPVSPADQQPQGVSRIWGSAGSDVYAVGAKDSLLHYDGTAWTPLTLPTPPNTFLSAVWGASGNDVFAGGATYSFPYHSAMLHFDGTTWSPMALPGDDLALPTYQAIQDIWGASGSDVFAIADYGRILHYDGSLWSKMDTPVGVAPCGIWGSSGHDVYAVGGHYDATKPVPTGAGAIWHYDGTSWSEVAFDVMVPAYDSGTQQWTERPAHTQWNTKVWGTSPSDVYVVNGDDSVPALLHFDGSVWSLAPTPCIPGGTCVGPFGGLWGSSATDVFAFTGWGDILHHGAPGPAGLSASDGLPGGTVALAWDPVAGAAAYQVHRSPRGLFDYTLLARVDADVTAYDDAVGCGSRGFDYRVAAVFADGALSAFSPVDVGFSGGCVPPTAPTLVAPAGTVWTTTPTYTWNAETGVASYHLQVGSGTTTALSAWYTAEQAGCASGVGLCSLTPATTLTGGRWEFTVQGMNDLGTGPWATAKVFDVSTTPTALEMLFPYDGYRFLPDPSPGANSFIRYFWKAQPGVSSYQLWVGTGTSTVHSAWYTAAEAYCNPGRCFVDLRKPPVGIWHYNIRGRNAGGTGPWTTARSFVIGVPPPAPTLLGPSGTIGTATPVFQWSPVPGADFYQLWVGGGPVVVLSQWYSAAAAGCATGTCSVTLPRPLAPGAWYFNVASKGVAGIGPWATAMRFTYIPSSAPMKLTLLAPSGPAGTRTPTFSWAAQAGVSSYQIWVGTASSTAYYVSYMPAAAGCGAGEAICSVTPGTALAAGNWFFNARGRNPAGTGPWSYAKGFSSP